MVNSTCTWIHVRFSHIFSFLIVGSIFEVPMSSEAVDLITLLRLFLTLVNRNPRPLPLDSYWGGMSDRNAW